MPRKKRKAPPTATASPDGLIDDKDVAALVGYSKKQIPKLIEAGVIPAPLTIGTGKKGERYRRRWHRGLLLAWLQEKAQQAAEAPR
jgi:predicted DNA-binding transcriptional regulator AlpA